MNPGRDINRIADRLWLQESGLSCGLVISARKRRAEEADQHEPGEELRARNLEVFEEWNPYVQAIVVTQR